MWKATIVNKEVVEDKIVVSVSFVNDALQLQYNRTFNISPDGVENLIKQLETRCASLEASATAIGTIPLGDVVPATETLEAKNKRIYQQKIFTLQRYLRAVQMGIIKADLPVIVELQGWLKLNFKPEYADLF